MKEENKMDKEIEINGVKYVPKDSIVATKDAKTMKGKRYVIARTYSAGVFAGYLDKRVGKEVTLLNARRLWSWEGAASLSQLAMEGTSKPENCKFPCEVSQVELTEVIEVLSVTEKARLSIASVAVWQK
jgi:hypothetical protein